MSLCYNLITKAKVYKILKMEDSNETNGDMDDNGYVYPPGSTIKQIEEQDKKVEGWLGNKNATKMIKVLQKDNKKVLSSSLKE
jgi:hypothetical protein